MTDNNEIIPCRRPDKLPVSFMQEQIIGAELAGLYNPAETRVNCPALSLLIKGHINTSALDKALCEIVRRHEILRTNYIVADKQIFQNINDAPDAVLQISDLRGLAQKNRKNETERILTELGMRPFSFFDNKLMITATLIIIDDDEYILTVITNHVAADGLSIMILHRELFVLYQAFFFNTASPLSELPIQYVDFAIWERKRYSGEFLDKKLDCWRKITNKINTFLPLDHTPVSMSYSGDIVPVSILPESAKRLTLLGRAGNVTFFTVLFSAFISLIHAFSGYRYNFFCIPAANRLRKETCSVMGCFMNFQFICVDLDDNPTFSELIKRVNKTLLDAYDNYVPFHFITEVIPPQGAVVDFQLQTSMDLTAPPMDKQSLRPSPGGLAALPFRLPQSEFALFPIDVFLSGDSGGVSGYFKYQTAVYNRSTILKLVNDYVILLARLSANPDMRIQEMGKTFLRSR